MNTKEMLPVDSKYNLSKRLDFCNSICYYFEKGQGRVFDDTDCDM